MLVSAVLPLLNGSLVTRFRSIPVLRVQLSVWFCHGESAKLCA